MEPHLYLQRRLKTLALSISDTVDLSRAWREGVGYKSFRIADNAVQDHDETERYAAMESTVLLHHACESLLRLYLAHQERTPCPWTELAGLLSFREFKQRAEQLRSELGTQHRVDDLMEAFAYAPDPSAFSNVTSEQWADHREALVLIVRVAIDVILDEAHIYNAAKHGLALLAGDVGMQIGPEAEPALIAQKGPALTYLERTPHGPWQVTTAWVRTERNLGVAYLVISQIESLWKVAQTHRLNRDPSVLMPLEAAKVRHVIDLEMKEGFNVATMSWPLHEAR